MEVPSQMYNEPRNSAGHFKVVLTDDPKYTHTLLRPDLRAGSDHDGATWKGFCNSQLCMLVSP